MCPNNILEVILHVSYFFDVFSRFLEIGHYDQVPRNVCQVLGGDMTDEVEDAVDYHESRDSDSDSEDEWE